ncbi:ABC transporter family protein [Rhodococcus sp. MTM3W5.2]|uniref:ABC transporter ATP-binding protein n=1 Tax=Rhodococcus sp. MTM3W5.2 TaxID=1805827 RepID=UPI00097912F9|nr:ATP-binding cassette domain-containing protein [Rhodococcus sp. MTM3W5.2]AQA21198.1 ABC transporter family protein [Rhodococcus sp. MTM3W5.2]
MIEAHRLTKRYGSTRAVDDLSFTARAGRVTALLGRSGAGKSTTLRMLLGLDHPTSGHALIGGRPLRDLERPSTEVGAILDADWIYRYRSARTHLRWVALTGRISLRRVDAVLEQVDLTYAADERIDTFSDGMLQRLGVAAALLGDPSVVIADAPFDERGQGDVAWIRGMLAQCARDGRTVLVSGRSVPEIAILADDLVIVHHGRVVTQCTTDEFIAQAGGGMLKVRSPQLSKLDDALRAKGIPTFSSPDLHVESETEQAPSLLVAATNRREVGTIAAVHELELSEVATSDSSLEDVFVNLISDADGTTARD